MLLVWGPHSEWQRSKALSQESPPGLTPSPLPSLAQILHYTLSALTVFSQSPCHKGNVHTMLDPL